MYCINLKRRTDRRLSAAREFEREGLDVEFFAGTDGCSDPVGLHVTASEYGCADSHMRVWRDIVAKGHPWGVVFEDDVLLDRGFKERMEALLKEAPEWDMIFLGHFYTIKGRQVSDHLFEGQPLGLHAYIISHECAKKLSTFDSRNIKVQIDSQISMFPIRILCANQPIARQIGIASRSDITSLRSITLEHYIRLYHVPVVILVTLLVCSLIEYGLT